VSAARIRLDVGGTLRAPMEAVERTVEGPGGRALQVWCAGPDDATPLVSHHGTPSSGLPYAPRVRDALAAGFRWVSYSRPGYGRSSRDEGRTVADAAADVAAILDHLGAERCCTIGGSGGGPHALATAAMLPDRVLSTATIASVAPYAQPDLDFFAGMGKENVEEFGYVIAGDREGLLAFMQRDAEAIATGDVGHVIELLGELLPPVDREVFTEEFAASFLADGAEAFREGVWGWYDDDVAFLRPWGFSLEDVAVPVALWQGELDKMVPEAHGGWLAKHVPAARLHRPVGHGHMSISERMYPEILDDLAAAAGLRGGPSRAL
jgi:pimeloyl-ACP methyl ester carboxylesterase